MVPCACAVACAQPARWRGGQAWVPHPGCRKPKRCHHLPKGHKTMKWPVQGWKAPLSCVVAQPCAVPRGGRVARWLVPAETRYRGQIHLTEQTVRHTKTPARGFRPNTGAHALAGTLGQGANPMELGSRVSAFRMWLLEERKLHGGSCDPSVGQKGLLALSTDTLNPVPRGLSA